MRQSGAPDLDSQFALAGTILQNMQFIGSQAARAGLASVILHNCSQALHDHTADCNKETPLQTSRCQSYILYRIHRYKYVMSPSLLFNFFQWGNKRLGWRLNKDSLLSLGTRRPLITKCLSSTSPSQNSEVKTYLIKAEWDKLYWLLSDWWAQFK